MNEPLPCLLEGLFGLFCDAHGDIALVAVDLPISRPHLDDALVVAARDPAASVAGLLLPEDLDLAGLVDRDRVEGRLHLDGAGGPVWSGLLRSDRDPDVFCVLVDAYRRYRQFGDEVLTWRPQVKPGLAVLLRVADRTVDRGHAGLTGE